MSSKYCYNCGTPRDPDGRFCGSCGADLGAPAGIDPIPNPVGSASDAESWAAAPTNRPTAQGVAPEPSLPVWPGNSSWDPDATVRRPSAPAPASPLAPVAQPQPRVDPPATPAPGGPEQVPAPPPPPTQADPEPSSSAEPAQPMWGGSPTISSGREWLNSERPHPAASTEYPVAMPGPQAAGAPTVVPTFDSLNGIMKSWDVRSALPAVGWALVPPVAVGLALGFWLMTQGVGPTSIPGSIGLMVGLTFGGSVSFGDEGLLTFTMLASSLTLASILGMFLGLRAALGRDRPATTTESLQRVAPAVVIVPVSAAILNLLANTMTGDAIAYAEPTSTFGRTLFGALMWGLVAAALAILAVPARHSTRTVLLRDYLDAPAAGLALIVIVSGVVVLILAAVSLLVQGAEIGELFGGLLFLLIQLPTLALALLGAAVFAPFDVGFLGFGASGTLVDAADENPWLWLLPIGFVLVGILGASWMLLRRADASRAKVDLAVFAGLAAVLGVLSAVVVSVDLQALGQGLTLQLSAAIVLILPLAALLWWFLSALLLSRAVPVANPGGAVARIPWRRPAGASRDTAHSAPKGAPGGASQAEPARFDSKPVIEQGLYVLAEATGDISDVATVVHQYAEVSSFFDSAMNPTDTCRLAFGGMIIRPDIRTSCFVALLQDRVAIAWRQGALKKSVVGLVVPFTEVTDVTWGAGTTAATQQAQVARIMTTGGEISLALPLAHSAVIGQMLSSTILGRG